MAVLAEGVIVQHKTCSGSPASRPLMLCPMYGSYAAAQHVMTRADGYLSLNYRQLEKQQKQLELLQLQHDEQQAAAEAAAKAAEAHRKALKQQLDIQTQMMARSHLKAAEQEEKQHAAELAAQSETRYMQRVAAAEQQAPPVAYFGRKKVEWYH